MGEPTWILDLKDKHNCSVLRNFEPGETRYVLAIIHEESASPPVQVKGRRSSDGEKFSADMPDGLPMRLPYGNLLRLIEKETRRGLVVCHMKS